MLLSEDATFSLSHFAHFSSDPSLRPCHQLLILLLCLVRSNITKESLNHGLDGSGRSIGSAKTQIVIKIQAYMSIFPWVL